MFFNRKPIVEKGTKAVLNKGRSVNVMNPEGIDNTNKHFAFGERCYLSNGGELEVVGEDPASKDLLVRYTAPDRIQPIDTLAPSGTLSFIEPKEFIAIYNAPSLEPKDLDLRSRILRMLENENK